MSFEKVFDTKCINEIYQFIGEELITHLIIINYNTLIIMILKLKNKIICITHTEYFMMEHFLQKTIFKKIIYIF